MIEDLLAAIRQRIDTACQRGGRDSKEITIVGVAKGQPVEKIQEAVQAGLTDIGENYAQELLSHSSKVRAEWHFVGHLQRRKVRGIIRKVSLIHSVDSWELAGEIDKRGAAIDKIQEVLLEVNLGGETSKTGLFPREVEGLATRIRSLPHVKLTGLMTLPPFDPDPEKSRPFFRELKKMGESLKLPKLSMGMTNDFGVAVEEGATLVRIGTGIFGERSR